MQVRLAKNPYLKDSRSFMILQTINDTEEQFLDILLQSLSKGCIINIVIPQADEPIRHLIKISNPHQTVENLVIIEGDEDG